MSDDDKKKDKEPAGSDDDVEENADVDPSNPKFFKLASIDAVLDHLDCTREGLTSEQVQARLQQYGYNKLDERHVPEFVKFLLFFWNPLSWTMELAALLALILGDYVDFILIMLLLTINASIGYYEERSSGNLMEALKSRLTPTAVALRDGKFQDIKAFELVPGDVIHLVGGNVIPADVKLLDKPGSKHAQMKIDQSSLTGESLPVTKAPGSECFAGSSVKSGDLTAVVYATGSNTFFGKAALLMASTVTHGHFQVVLKEIGLFCIVLIAIGVAIELSIQFPVRQSPCTGLSWQPGANCTTLDNILVLIVGGIPIAMPTVLSVTMALGAGQLAKKQAIVARLSAVEEMAAMDILCSDKTGTLTLNHLTVKEACPVDGDNPTDPAIIYLHAALGAAQVKASADAIDQTVIEALAARGEKDLLDDYEQLHLEPFDPVSKRSVATVKNKKTGEIFKVAKGAPQVFLKYAANKDSCAETATAKINDFGMRGYRSLGVAYCESPVESTEEDEDPTSKEVWIYEGLLSIEDPPRIDTKEVIEKVGHYGIKVKMITGDQMAIARETCRQLGMGSDIQTPEHLEEAEANGNLRAVEEADGFAQVFPEHKYNIVAALQKLNHVVGMTGDGVNDAPALKKADIGIAVADATDAARTAADIVLVSPGLSVIVDAIFGSRKIFQRMRNYVLYSISATVRVCFTFMLLTVIWDFYFPTIVIAIMAILNDGTILTISKDRVKPSQTPDAWRMPRIFIFALVLGGYMMIESIVLFVIVYETNILPGDLKMPTLNDAQIRGLIYLNVSISGQATIFVTRTEGWWFRSRPSVLLMIAFLVAQATATLIGLFGLNGYPNNTTQDFSGCGWPYALFCWIYSFAWFLFKDPLKFIIFRVIDLFVWVGPVKRTKKAFGHPIYGRHGSRALHFGTMWPQMEMAPLSYEDVAEVAAELRRNSLELADQHERPWHPSLDTTEMKKLRKHKKKAHKHKQKRMKKHIKKTKGGSKILKKDAPKQERTQEDESALVKGDDHTDSEEGDYLHSHHHAGHHRHKHSSDDDETETDSSSAEIYVAK